MDADFKDDLAMSGDVCNNRVQYALHRCCKYASRPTHQNPMLPTVFPLLSAFAWCNRHARSHMAEAKVKVERHQIKKTANADRIAYSLAEWKEARREDGIV